VVGTIPISREKISEIQDTGYLSPGESDCLFSGIFWGTEAMIGRKAAFI
jgi:hypothetical protein